MLRVVLIVLLSFFAASSYATRFWTTDLTDWTLHLNNSAAYVTSSSLPEQCKFGRAQIEFSTNLYDQAIWQYVLAASKSVDNLRVVLDHDQNATAQSITCVVLSASTF